MLGKLYISQKCGDKFVDLEINNYAQSGAEVNCICDALNIKEKNKPINKTAVLDKLGS